MRILVTGGAGFIASHVVDRFIELGHDVLVLDDLSSGVREHVNARARLVVDDVRAPTAAEAVRAFSPEVLCHHAAQIDVRKSVDDPVFDVDVNLRGLVNVMEGARKGKALAHVLFASSGGAMYGEQETFPAPESHPVRPESPYGLAKAVSEQYLEWYRRCYRIGYTALRYGNVYGPRQNPHGEAGVVAIFSSRILDGKGITIYGDGGQTRDYVFVGDVVEANARALAQRPQGGFNIGTGAETDVNRLARALVVASATSVEITHAPPRAGEQRRSVIDPAAFSAATGWKAKVGIDEGLLTTYAWFKAKR